MLLLHGVMNYFGFLVAAQIERTCLSLGRRVRLVTQLFGLSQLAIAQIRACGLGCFPQPQASMIYLSGYATSLIFVKKAIGSEGGEEDRLYCAASFPAAVGYSEFDSLLSGRCEAANIAVRFHH